MAKSRLNLMLFIILAFAVIVSGCATFSVTTTMTDKQQGVMWMGVYNSEYDSVKLTLESPVSTPEQKALAEKKKGILVRAYPLIKDFTSPVSPIDPTTGKPWTNAALLKYTGPIVGYSMSADKLAILNGLIDELTALMGGTS
jgi:hypothetical protein